MTAPSAKLFQHAISTFVAPSCLWLTGGRERTASQRKQGHGNEVRRFHPNRAQQATKMGLVLPAQMSAVVGKTAPLCSTARSLVVHRQLSASEGEEQGWDITAMPCDSLLAPPAPRVTAASPQSTNVEASRPDVQHCLFSRALRRCPCACYRPAFPCAPRGHAARGAARPRHFSPAGPRHLPHTCCMAGTRTELLILLFEFHIPVFKCCLCNLCLASPQRFGGEELLLYLNSLMCHISFDLIFSSF